ncbi:MAG TPA: response regulator [Acidimicrobiia bacterium]|nr:response regulator [Acidimicrobiia bacterium]
MAAFIVVVTVLDGYGIFGLRQQYVTPLVVDVTSRQRALVERYIKDVALKLDNVRADPSESADALAASADGLLHGGIVPSPQGSLDDRVRVPGPSNATVRVKLAHERDLVHELIAEGTALLREGKTAPSYGADLQALRVKGAQLSSVTGDAAGEEARVAKEHLSRLARVQIALGALGALVAIGMALLVRRSANRQSERFRSLVHNSSDLITVVDEHAIATYQSPSAVRVLGYEPAEIEGSKLSDLLHPNDKSRVIKTFADISGRPGATVELTFRLRHRNGMWVTMEGTVRNLIDDKSVGAFVVNSRDITERVRAAEELGAARDEAMHASRLKSEFLASMSHEIRTPMNAVIGLNELLLGTELDGEQREYAAGVGTAAQGLLGIINDILDFSKVEAGKLSVEIVDFDLDVLLEDVVALLADAAQAKGLELLAHPYPDLPTAVRGDPTRLRQVLVNLVSNAVKFTSSGEVILRAKPVSDRGNRAVVRFEVSDTGMGIAPADQARMFEPFAQADASTTRRFGGTGLGLAIVRQLVELMGGELGVDSEVDRGSTFWFELPFERQHVAPVTPSVHVPEFTSLRAIVVDDNATNRLILRQQLTSWGLRPDEAEDAPSALERIRAAAATAHAYDLAILDLNMPGMDGLELAHAIKADTAITSLKLFLLSSSGRVRKDIAADAGLSGTLSKPVRQSELFNCLVEGLQMDNPSSAAPATGPSANIQQAPSARGAVLLVEDNTMNQLVATGMLTKLGYRFDVAANGREALDAINAREYDAVLMDCQMPEMDGYEATRRLRDAEVGNGRHLPVIAMTAAAMQGDRERCLAAGMDDYITKPISQQAIAKILERWTEPTPDDAAPHAAETVAPPPVLDAERFAVLRDLDAGDGELLGTLVRAFLADGAALLAAIHEGIAEGDPHTVERTSHTLKGASANLGAVRLADVCAQLEGLGRAAALGTAPRLLDDATREFESVRGALTLEVSEA